MIDELLDKINSIIDQFVKSIDEDYSARFAADFMACLDEDVVEWALAVPENDGAAFYDNFIERFPHAAHYSFFLLCLLHEVGHLETEWNMIDDVIARNKSMRPADYYKLHNERIATDWAGEWLADNPRKAQTLDRELTAAINEFYAANLIE